MSSAQFQQQRSTCAGEANAPAGKRAFTLIELLVVISIIGVLAGLVVGLSGLATRKSKEARIRMEMTKLVSAIENYKSSLGFYPPDHQSNITAQVVVGVPSPNQLYYELSGMVYQDRPLPARFFLPGSRESFLASDFQAAFNTVGIANAARDARDLKFKEEFKSSQYKRISANPPIDVLAVPAKGPANITITFAGVKVNPWMYVSTSPTNNPDRFDLWAEVEIGGKTVRFSNWEKDPVVISP